MQCGVAQPTVCGWEHGTKVPGAGRWNAVANAYDITIREVTRVAMLQLEFAAARKAKAA